MISALAKPRALFSSLWFALIAIFSLLPLGTKNWLHTTGHWHQPLHVIAFLIAGLFLFNGTRRFWTRAAGLILFCGILEWLQTLLYGNGFEWQDLFNDGMGVIFALFWVSRRRHGGFRKFSNQKETTKCDI